MIFDARRPVLITGGAGFIGTNLAHHLLEEGQPVLIYDNLSRAGVAENLAWLREQHGSGRLQVQIADVRDATILRRAVRRACRVFHFAAQVAVTTSLEDPLEDFEVNARGTLNLLEAIRATADPPPLLYTSTNKVYGTLAELQVALVGGCYLPREGAVRERGIGESHALDFHSPYGCSKGAADQYVLDYARIYGLPAVVFRMSCIYGPHQRGNEDQGWVAHFLLRVLCDEAITIYGDGRQVRDALHADDLVQAMCKAQVRIDRLSGRAFNIGGGPGNAISLRELLQQARRLHGRLPEVRFGAWRPADQRYYVSNIEAFSRAAGWRPKIAVEDGVERVYASLRSMLAAGSKAAASPPAMAAARS
jgi:CDP-paratose 2-epimerase